jgi:hypothetical protein
LITRGPIVKGRSSSGLGKAIEDRDIVGHKIGNVEQSHKTPIIGRITMQVSRAGLVLCCVSFLVCAPPKAADQEKTITVTGKLLHVVGIGGETTGWAIRLDSEIEIKGKRIVSIEVHGEKRDLLKLENKHVEAMGTLSVRHGVERGEWAVLEVSSIRESAGNH